ncbi:uncharacterized protein LOC122027784 [Zingiber officinale]|uniref:LysM domain-containing protein n=1 Tax=Zingiber officinale TaxID=94328 RepID=A0A8J5EVN1_ZINOF|nr:uncharacterized protein LOC122027784 [Zingiber officinale]KAG6474586.1 hypothetical protein ZIOFF_068524 [Zingiber officinale]
MGSLSHERKYDTFAPLSSPCALKYIEHHVSKLDTLAGVAIKYGVEIADIKRTNCLTTDLQLFAHKILLIPLPGRHPPSTPIQFNGSLGDRDDSATHSPKGNIFDSLQPMKLNFLQNSDISPVMSSLQRCYDLPRHKNGITNKSTEMTVYRTGSVPYFQDNLLPKISPSSETQSRRSMGLLRSYHSDNDVLQKALQLNKCGDASDGEKSKLDKSVRHRQKADTDAWSTAVEGIINKIGRGLAPRALLASLMDHTSPSQETSQTASFLTVIKSFSSLSLQEENDSAWSYSRGTPKPDSITKPILSSLSKQISVWRSKAALD